MTRIRPVLSTTALFLAAAAFIAGCSQDKGSNPASDSPVAGIQDMADAAMRDAVESGVVASGDAPLEPGQSIQGTIEADVGKGTQSFRSLSTKLADDLDKQVADKIDGNREVQAAIDDGNARLEKLGTATRVSSDDVKSLIGSMAGKTFHDSSVMHIGMVNLQTVSIEGTAGDGSKIELGLEFDSQSLAFQSARFSYQPDPKSIMNRFSTDKKNPPEVTIERFEKNADGSFALAGSFKASDVPASATAKKLKGQTLASASGSFKFESLPAREMPKFGR